MTRWSRLDNLWEGVAFREMMRLAKPSPDARFVTIHCYGGYTTNLALDALLAPDVLLAHSHDGLPLAPEHGWPLRLVVPGRYGWKSAKWVNGIEFMAQRQAGLLGGPRATAAAPIPGGRSARGHAKAEGAALTIRRWL